MICIAAIFWAYRKKGKGVKEATGPLLLLNLDKAEQDAEPPSAAPPEDAAAAQPEPEAPSFQTLQKRPWVLADLGRALLILLSLVVASGFALILLPQPAVDKLAQDLQSRHGASRQEMISLLYLGDEAKDGQFHVRGVVRNITAAPIEQLDAAVRFYAHDGSILETTIVRMNKETIAPDETAQFELVYPNYRMQFASYAAEFKLRQGALVPYKDMRASRAQSQQPAVNSQ